MPIFRTFVAHRNKVPQGRLRADSLALRGFLRLGLAETPPEHSTISRTHRLIDLERHRAVFTWILQVLATADRRAGDDPRRGLWRGQDNQLEKAKQLLMH